MKNKKQQILNDSILNMAANLPLTQVAKLHGVSRQYVCALCSKNGLKKLPKSILFTEVWQ